MKSKMLLLVAYIFQALMVYPHPTLPLDVFVREGEIAILTCRVPARMNSSTLLWGKNSSMGFEELREEVGRPLIKRNKKLFMMKALRNDSGTYSCMIRNGSVIVKQALVHLTVYTECYIDDNIYDDYCNEKKSCTIQNRLTSVLTFLCGFNVSWYKVSDSCQEEYISSKKEIYFYTVSKRDEGTYLSRQFCKYKDQFYYASKINQLKVKESQVPFQPKIVKPAPDAVIDVDIGQKAEIICLVVLDRHSEAALMDLHWINGSLAISMDQNTTIYYNSTKIIDEDNYQIIAWLILKNVSKSHLNTTFTCKLESTLQEHINVSVTLRQKVAPKTVWSLGLSLGIVGSSAFLVVIVTVVYYKLRIDIVLFFRDLQRDPFPPTDGKLYDAYISYYKTCSEEALTKEEQALLLDVLEAHFGYRLCVYDRDVLPGKAAVEAVLEHVKLSRRLMLVPTAQGPEAEDQYGLLAGLHAALVDRHTRLILIQKMPHCGVGSLPEPLCLLARSEGAVSWRGDCSASLSSKFWKQILYHMPARRRQPSDQLVPL